MNDIEFTQRAYANPFDEGSDFIEAVAASDSRQKLVQELRALDKRLRDTGNSVSPSEGLRKKLLNPEMLSVNSRPQGSSSNDAYRNWSKISSVAAGVLLALGVVITGLNFWAGSADRAFADEVLAHLYSEIEFLESSNQLTLNQVNQIMADANITVRLVEASENEVMEAFKVNDAMECLILRDDVMHKSLHMVIPGEQGVITVMVIPSSPVTAEMNIADSRFNGVITPVEEGNVVVIGENQETLTDLSTLIANNISF